jgi:hypothetical protein
LIRIQEYGTTAAQLRREDLSYLITLVKGAGQTLAEAPRILEAITPTGERDVYELRAGAFIGRLGLPSGETLEFVSRFGLDDVIELIRLSGRLPLRRDALPAAAEEERFLLDALAAALVREVERLLGLGLAKGYHARRFLAPPFPGTVDLPYLLGPLAGRDRLATRAKRITTDVEVNRALALAVDVLRRATLPVDLAVRLSRAAAGFRSVSRIPMSADDVARLTLTRLNGHYADALALAEIVLRSQALAPREVQLSGASVVFSMPKVWEDCVARWVGEAWGGGYRATTSHTFDLSSAGELSSVADVVVWRGQELVGLYDAKYKFPDKAPSLGDVYQMVTYCERLGLDTATLVYPLPTSDREYVVGGRRIRVVGVSHTRRSPGPGEPALVDWKANLLPATAI